MLKLGEMFMIRNLSLSEWFLAYQLDYIDKKHNHLNAFAEVDLTKIYNHFGDTKNPPLTTILIKAASLWQVACPEINRQIFRTPWSTKFYSCDTYSVNVPALIKHEAGDYLTVMNIQNPSEKSLSTIKEEMNFFLKKDPKSLPVGQYVYGRPNTLMNRLRLKIIHFIVNNFLGIYQKNHVGTVSVSSLLKMDIAHSDMLFVARGPGAMTLCVCGLDTDKKTMKIGVGWDHATGNGHEGISATAVLSRILSGHDEELFKKLNNNEIFTGHR